METKKLFLYFNKYASEKPIVYHLVKDFDLVINIFRARINDEEEGYMVLDVTGESDSIRKGIDFIRLQTVLVDETGKGVRWDETRCTHCGNCITHCPTDALHIPDRNTMLVTFDSEKCVECLACIKHCPFEACSSVF